MELFGFDDDELADRQPHSDSRTHPDDVPQMPRDRDDHFAGRTPRYVNEHRARCKDGSWKWVLSRGMVIDRDAADRHLLNLVDDVLDVSSAQNGAIRPSWGDVDPVAVLLESWTMLSAQAAQAGVRLDAAGTTANLPEWRVRADRRRLTQAMNNLLSNAIKCNREGGTVAVQTTARAWTRASSSACSRPSSAWVRSTRRSKAPDSAWCSRASWCRPCRASSVSRASQGAAARSR